MDEKMIAQIVEAVVQKVEQQKTGKHTCKCHNKKMTLSLAEKLIEAVEKEAERRNMKIVAAVADQAARPVAVHCMDDSYIASFDIALQKSFTSASLKMSTQTLGVLSQPGQSLYGIQHTNEGRLVIFGGGEPLLKDETVIGALGVSGGTALEDTELAAYGKRIFEEVILCQ